MKLICGPMATISHPAFRILVEKFGGCDEYFTEMINAPSLMTGGPFEEYYLNPFPCPEKIVWQLTSKNSDFMIQAVQQIVTLPGIGIDLNMGCSAPDIYNSGAGISWMIKPITETSEMVYGVRKIIENYNQSNNEKKRFSVKLRLGDDDFSHEGFIEFCDMLVDNGVELLTLHPRTKKEKLIRPPRYSFCEEIALRYKEKGIGVYLNGNVKDLNSYKNAIINAPDVDGVMISRASVQNPWIFKMIKDFDSKQEASTFENKVDMKEIALEYIDNIEKYQPKEFWKTRLQRFFTYFAMNFVFSHYAQTMFLNASDNDDLRNKIEIFFEKCPEERYKFF